MARDWQKRDVEISLLSSILSRGSGFIWTDDQPSGRPLMPVSLYASWPPTQSFGRGTLHRWHRSYESSTIPFRPARIAKIREVYLRNNYTPATFLCDNLLCSRKEGGARFYLILSPLCNEGVSRYLFCWIFFASFFNQDDRCDLYYSVQNLTRNSLSSRLYE